MLYNLAPQSNELLDARLESVPQSSPHIDIPFWENYGLETYKKRVIESWTVEGRNSV